jgi:hypothetical protein
VTPYDPNRTFIAGFVVAGTTSKRVLVRAVGSALAKFGVQSVLANPRLRLFDHNGQIVAENDDWTGSDVSTTSTNVGAFALDAGSKDAALVATLGPGAYSFQVTGDGGSGVALAEIYDANGDSTSDGPPLVNISTRGMVGAGEAALIAGFVVRGDAPKRFLIRGVGPGLAQFGVGGVLADPMLTLYQNNTPTAQNDDWETGRSVAGGPVAATAAEITAASSSVGAFALKTGSKDAALVVTLPPGSYSAVVTGTNGGTGVALLEVYDSP